MSVDPSHYLPAANGGKPPLLKLQNIAARPELNGQFGQAVAFQAGRYVVALLDATTAAAAAGGGGGSPNVQPTMLKLKPENLTEAGSLDQLKFGAAMAFQSAQSYIASPAVQEWGKRIIAKLPPAVRSKVTPNRALLGAAIAVQSILFLLYLLVGKFMGFTKVFVLVSLVALVLAVSSPDWVEGYKAKKPPKMIARSAANNFTRRWKDNLVNMTGYTNISEKMALASLVFVLIFSGKVLLTPSAPTRPPLPPQMSNMPMGGNNMQPTIPNIPPKYDLEYIYKLGYDDAKSDNEFGTSLPEEIIQYNAAQENALPTQEQYDDANNNYEWAYNPPPPPPPQSKSNLGMGTLLSMFTLYRFGKDVVTTPDGQLVLDPQYAIAQLRSIEPWRLGIMGMSLYRVVTALSSFLR